MNIEVLDLYLKWFQEYPYHQSSPTLDLFEEIVPEERYTPELPLF